MVKPDGWPFPVRRTGNRRKQQVQKLADEAVQILKALDAELQKAMDTYRDSSPQWLNGSLRSDLYLRLRTSTGEIHHPLPQRLFYSIWFWGVHMESKARKLPKNHRKDSPSDSPTKLGGLSKDAGSYLLDDNGRPYPRCVEDIYNGGE